MRVLPLLALSLVLLIDSGDAVVLRRRTATLVQLPLHDADAQPKPWDYEVPEAVMATHFPGSKNYYGGANSQAMRNGAPLPRPASIVRCPPGGCNETYWDLLKDRRAKRQAAPSPLPTILPAQSQNFQQTCQGITWTLTGTSPKLSARCYDQTGVLRSSSAVIDNCIGNNNGVMECSLPNNMFWAATCTSCTMTGTVMRCSCINARTNGVYRTTTLDTAQCFGNNNGQLYCTNHKA